MNILHTAFALTLGIGIALLINIPTSAATSIITEKTLEKSSSNVPFLSRSEYLDTEQKYLISWNISTEDESIEFQVSAETKGFVGFGISPSGGMTGADILIAGLNSDGSFYFSDRHGVGNMEPVEDTQANWKMISISETDTHTIIRFSRPLNTCDEDDIMITDGTMRLIWALGETDTVSYHGTERRGTKSVNLFMEDESDFKPEKYKPLDLLVNTKMPTLDTAYWCTIHSAPLFTKKQHIVAIEAVLANPHAIQHTHHFTLFRCIAPEGEDPEQIFEPWVNHEGDFCYNQKNASFPFNKYCNGNIVYVWSKGGKRLVFPPDLGLPIPEKLGAREYFAMEIHYDNPNVTADLEFETGARMYYTEELREEEVAIMLIAQGVQVQLTVPPLSKDFIVSGHCSPQCTDTFLPEYGVTIFNNLFHAHLAGRKLKLRHFRGEEELSWVDVDEYYDFNFQQNKRLTKYRKVEKGDQLTVECTYDTTASAHGGKAVVGGLSTKEEMCEAIVYYYPKQKFSYCASGQNVDKHFQLLGVTKYKVKDYSTGNWIPDYIIEEPISLQGDYVESVSEKVNWTQEMRERYQKEKRYGEQIGACNGGDHGQSIEGVVSYPENLRVYVPPDNCSGSGSGSIMLSPLVISVMLITVYFGN